MQYCVMMEYWNPKEKQVMKAICVNKCNMQFNVHEQLNTELLY